MATHSSILAWSIPWTEEPGGLQFKWLQRVRHDWATNTFFQRRQSVRGESQLRGPGKQVIIVMLGKCRPHDLMNIFCGPCCCCCCVASVVSDSVWPQRRQPTRLPRPWDSPGKNTGVGCHFLLQCMKVKSESEVTQSCPTLVTPWTAAHQAPPSTGFSRQKYWSGVSLPSPLWSLPPN